ncbi:hypothetical protein RJ55_04313 [Drechmeria coniospora]|nr:hypothetical protein RJ55_04313 [Drechmeria coniospora]
MSMSRTGRLLPTSMFAQRGDLAGWTSRARHLLLAVILAGLLISSTVLFFAYSLPSRIHGVFFASVPPLGPAEAPPSIDDDAFTLHPEHHIFREAKTIYLTWNVTQERRAPDGVVKSVYLINGQFPGPLVEARSGDEIVANVYNSIPDEREGGISLHWHGLTMKGANEMDGVVGLTQCAIAPSTNFTYRFRIDESQSGTYWYHAHSGVQRADGLFGGLVIHKPASKSPETADPATYRYEKEQLLMVGDWYHRAGGEVLEWFVDPNHYAYEPAPESILINGRGSYNCSLAVPARPVNCSAVARPALALAHSHRVRLRVVNTSISSGLTLTLTHATMTVMTVDGGHGVANTTRPARSVGVLYPGERMDLIVDRETGAHGASAANDAEIVVTLDRENMGLYNFALVPEQPFPLRWSRGRRSPEHGKQDADALPHLSLGDLQGAPLDPSTARIDEPAERAVLYLAMQVRAASHNHPVGTVNHTSWLTTGPMEQPLLALDRDAWAGAVEQPTSVQKLKVPWFKESGEGRWIELVLNNFDDKGHPFHMHGYDFYVVFTGQAIKGYNPFDAAAAEALAPTFNTANPLRKDTVYVPSMGYVVLRFALDNDGLWLLHCHVLWHQAIGMGIAFQVGPGIARDVRERASATCPARRPRQ